MTAINFPANPSNGDTHQGFVYNSTLGVWQSAGSQTAITSFTGLSDTPSTLGTAGQIAKVNSGATALEFADQSGVTVYANVDALPGSGNTGDLAFVTATNRLYIWNGSGWYNIALINTTPSISGVNSSYELATDGTATVITITAVDAEGLPITYSIASDTSGNIATVTQGTGANTNIFTITPSTNAANAGTFSLTFRASDGVNLATALASFELQFTIINSNYTTALITSVGTNNATNSLVADNSTNDYGFALYGTNSTQGTFSPYRHGGYSTYFNGTSDYLNFNGSSISIGTGDFTIEAYVYHTGNSDDVILSTTGCTFGYGVNGQLRFYTGTGSNIIDSGTAFISGRWVHIAAVRTSGVLKMFQDGTEVYSGAYNHNIASFTSALIGRYHASAVAYYEGYITDLRVVAGTALYTSNYTPPTQRLTAITNTQLLTCHLPYIADGSTNSHSITINGSTKTEPFAPYDSQTYTAADHGSSYYFGGLGNHVASTSGTGVAAPGSGDFCLEFWVYPTSSGISSLFDYRPYNANSASGLLLFKDASNRPYLYANAAQRILATDAIPVNVWSHIAVTRNSGTHYLYVNGKQQSGTWTDSTTWTTGAYRPIFMQSGYHAAGNSPGNYYNTTGNMTDIRLVTGSSVYTTDFTPSTSPLTAITNTQLLLNAERAGIIDKSQSVKTLTLNGDVKSSTTQSKYLTSSMYFDGTGDYITLSDSDAREFGGEDFTIELWVKTTIATQYATLISRTPTTFGNGMWTILMNNTASGGEVAMYIGDVAGDLVFSTSGASIRDDSWHHVAVVRNGSSFVCYIDGTSRGTGSWAGSIANIAGDIRIGADQTYGRNWEGYMSDLRITKGLARYTANFTPPTAELKG